MSHRSVTFRFARIAAPLVYLLLPLWAVETQTWDHSDASDFEKGTLKGLSLSSDGHLTPAPILRQVQDASTTFLWAIARDSKGILYAGGGGVSGSKAKLIAIDNQGRTRSMELDGMAVQALAIDKQNRVYAATTPDGKIYRLDSGGEPKVFYDPKAKYIWALAFSKAGDLYVATGDTGEIHKVSEKGEGSVFYRSEETNVRSLAIDANDNVIAGTDASGLVLRITPKGEGFVLYEAPKREITAVMVAPDGAIYAAGTGNKGAAAPAPAAAAPAQPAQSSQGTVNITGPGGRGAAPQNVAPAPAGVPGGSEIYRIQPDGYARKVWNHAQDVVYALAFDGQGRLVMGTGNHGNVYRLDSARFSTKLLNVAPAQVTGFAAGPNGRLYMATGNIGQVYSLGPELEASGTYESDVLDARAFSNWGRMTSLVTLQTPGQGSVELETRSGNVSRAQKDWSPWSKLNSGRAVSPPARFLQYRATVGGSAELYGVSTAYEMKNVAPLVEIVETTQANYKFPAPVAASASANPATLNLPALGRKAASTTSAPATDSGTSPALAWSKGWMGARWLANDDNGDTLRFTVEIRGESETAWKPLRENLRERYYSWDSTSFADGKYRLRITASDAPSNTPEQALSSSSESDLFLIDNTAPEISGLSGTSNGNLIDIRFHAKDAWNVLAKAEYSVNGGEWKVVEPTTRITDSAEHDYRFQTGKGTSETTIAVRVSDAYENEAVAKTVVK